MSELAKQFEELWESSETPPDVFEFVQQHNGSDIAELLPVLLLDQSRRWKTDEPLKVEDYVARIPRLGRNKKAVIRLLAGEFEAETPAMLEVEDMDFLRQLKELSSFTPKDEATRSVRPNHDPQETAETVSLAEQPAVESTIDTRRADTGSIPLEVSDYEFLDEIGRGGMGIVYKARHRKLNRLVALKLIKSGEFADPEQIRRFQTEAEALAKLDHSGIVPVFDVGEVDGKPFFTMAFVNGQSLDERVKGSGPLLPEEAAALVKSVAEALDYAHSKGVLHRDIKPHNILFDSENGQPRITDFGLAKHLETDSDLTATGQVVGTPNYMPPEQAAGRHSAVDVKSDVYSLGATLYFLLVARPPFQSATSVETIQQVLENDPVSPRSLNTNVSNDLATICLKCLSKEPERRYLTAGELAEDLSRWLNGEPISARPVSKIEKAWKWCKRRPALVGTVAAAVLVLIAVSLILVERRNDAEATRLVEGLLQAETSQVGSIIANLSGYEDWAEDDLQRAFDESVDDSNAKLHAALAMLPDNKSVLPTLRDRLLTVTPMQFAYVRDLLEEDKDSLIEYYREVAKGNETPALRFQAACALATYDSDDEYWQDEEFCSFVAGHLASVRPSELLPWTNALRPVKEHLFAPLAVIYRNPKAGEQVRSFATDTLADYLSDHADGLFDLLADANEKQFGTIFKKLDIHREKAVELGNAEVGRTLPEDADEKNKESLAMRQANAAVMLLKMNAADQVWPLLKHSPDPRVRSYIIHWLSPRGGDAKTIIARYEQEADVTIKRALLLCLGEFDLVESQKQPLIEALLTVYRSDPDAGMHAAAEWLLRQWEQGETLASIDKELQQSEVQLLAAKDKQQQWYINGQGQTFVILDAGEFQMGSPETEANYYPNESLHLRSVARRIAISTKEVTRKQWRAFSESNSVIPADADQSKPYIHSDDSPMIGMTWYEAAHYCNWLSEQEGVPEDQWCYEKNEDGEYGPGMTAKENFLELTGYRLPTEAEWEYCCRSNTTSSRYYGLTEELLPRYAWYQANGQNRTHPVASLKPNDFGLFDMQGNVYEWCYDVYASYPPPKEDKAVEDAPPVASVEDADRRVLRGGAFKAQPRDVRSARRSLGPPTNRIDIVGFRPSRTCHIFP